jgi:lipid-binding SYLF domain-containing protein
MQAMTVMLAALIAGVVALTVSPGAWAGPDGDEKAAKTEEKRDKIDEVVDETLQELLKDPSAKALYDKAYGYAVFDSRKMALLLKSGGGVGVAVDKSTDERTYMRMGSLGVGVGIGVELFQAVFLFEDEARFTEFVEDGWVVESTATATAGEEGASATASSTDTDTAAAGVGAKGGFNQGVAIYRFTEKGLIASADVSGTKYWRDKNLNSN